MNTISKTQPVSEADSLLEEGQAFKLTPVGGRSFEGGKIALTWRWPREKDGRVSAVISTSVVNARNLHKLRVEAIDGQYFLISESTKDYEQEIRFCVESERVGLEIIRGIVKFIASKPVELDNDAKLLGIPARVARLNRVAEYLLPLACFAFCASSALAALFFVLS